MKKRKNLLIVVIVLDLTITALSLALGCLMYASNKKSIIHNQIYVEMTDFISNIEYGLHFGKSLESYYGMEDELKSVLGTANGIDGIFVVNADGETLFKTNDTVLSREISTLAGGSDLKKGNMLYCSYDFASDARLITVSDISGQTASWKAYYKYLCFVAFAGFFVSAGLMYLIFSHSRNPKRGYYVTIAILFLWIVIISSFVGYSTYTEYRSSITGLDEAIRHAIKTDMDYIRSEGIKDENLTGIGAYLLRYSDNINEIDKITFDGNTYEFELSDSYMRRKLADYILQTLLFLAFSSMILAEYQIFMSHLKINVWEDDKHE